MVLFFSKFVKENGEEEENGKRSRKKMEIVGLFFNIFFKISHLIWGINFRVDRLIFTKDID